MSSFKECESYKHKSAKKVFIDWYNKKEEDYGEYIKFDTNFTESGEPVNISWRSNWAGVIEEYPIVIDEKKGINSVNSNIMEQGLGGVDAQECFDSVVPTFDQLKQQDIYPLAIVDLVPIHKGIPAYFIEICHKNPVNSEKVKKLEEAGVFNLIEIDADWILNQVKVPDKLNIKRWLI